MVVYGAGMSGIEDDGITRWADGEESLYGSAHRCVFIKCGYGEASGLGVETSLGKLGFSYRKVSAPSSFLSRERFRGDPKALHRRTRCCRPSRRTRRSTSRAILPSNSCRTSSIPPRTSPLAWDKARTAFPTSRPTSCVSDCQPPSLSSTSRRTISFTSLTFLSTSRCTHSLSSARTLSTSICRSTFSTSFSI